MTRITMLVAKGGLYAVEWALRALAGAVEASTPKHFARGGGSVRTVSGTIEPLAYDEFGRRVGATSGSPAVEDQ
jgi:hypothetical protein